MILSHKIALDPTLRQREYFAKAAGCARFVWNLALAEWNRRFDAGEKPNHTVIRKDFNAIKYFAFPWIKDIHRDAHSEPFRHLQKAFNAFFNKTGAYPRFKKKGQKDSFYAANDLVQISNKMIRLPRIGWVKMYQCLRFLGKVMGATISRTADRWFVSIQVDVGEIKRDRAADKNTGVDLGINSALSLSTGEKIPGPKSLKKELRKLRRLQRSASRKTKGGKNQKNVYKKVARIHARAANIRKDFWHKITTRLCRENQAIAIETLNVKALARNKKLARALADVSFGMMRPMLEYKSKIYGNNIVVVDRWFPSSKTCNVCGFVKEKLSLSERKFNCESCGVSLDRDVNAAINLKNQIPVVGRKSMSADCECSERSRVKQKALKSMM